MGQMRIENQILLLYVYICSLHVFLCSTHNKDYCLVNINGIIFEKSIGDVWTSPEDVCVKFTCRPQSVGIAIVSMFREYCYENCYSDHDLIFEKDKCCGECVHKNCIFANKTYDIGDSWTSGNGCRSYQCVGNSITENILQAMTISYQTPCSMLKTRSSYDMFKICCPYFGLDIHTGDLDNKRPFYINQKYNEVMSRNTYIHHPCRRECDEDGTPKICYYKFVVEWYETLSKACFNCPYNESDCFRSQCIHADGFRRSVLVVNRMMPGPTIDICKYDRLIIDVENNLLGESTSIHWHGLHQRETPFYDGVPMITQCPIPPHTTFRYDFVATNAGTHWWHSHLGMQRADGAFGALIVREPIIMIPSQIKLTYSVDLIDHTILLQDWDHKIGVSIFNSFHHSIGDNKPKNILINGKGRYSESQMYKQDLGCKVDTIPVGSGGRTAICEEESEAAKKTVRKKDSGPQILSNNAPFECFKVREGLKYRFRTINSGFLNCPLQISIDNHTLLIISSDGHYIEPIMVETLVLYAGERFDFVLHSNQPLGNYWIRVKGLMDCDARFLKVHQGAILHYIGADERSPEGILSYEYQRLGLQLNSLNRGPGQIDSLAMVEVTSVEPDTPELLAESTDYKFYVHFDFYEKSFPNFNNPSIYNIQSVSKEQRYFGPQLNLITMKTPSTPLLMRREYNDFCNSTSLAEENFNCLKDVCECTHVLQVPLNATVEVILVDEGFKYDANHPFHLHGHDFRVVAMERVHSAGVTVEKIQRLDEMKMINRKLIGAPIKDTVTVPDGGFTIIRFIATNPGFWIFHCHIEFHIEVGMALVFKVGDYSDISPLPMNFPPCSSFTPELVRKDMLSSIAIVNWTNSTFLCALATLFLLIN